MSTTFSLISQNVLQSETHEVRFDNIPQNFKDLYLIASMDCNTTTGNYGNAINIKFNGRTDLFSSKVLEGYASTLTQSTQTTGYAFRANNDNSNQTANTFSINELHIPDYSRSDNVKLWNSQCVAETNNTSYNEIVMWAGKWNNTNPITSISIYDPSGNRFKVGCSFYLYGIKNSSYIPSTFGIEATGGDEVISNGYKYHVFKSSGTLNVASPGWVETLVVAGGGGGGGDRGGGGGAGGVKFASMLAKNGPNNVIVGAGGVGGSVSGAVQPGGNGNDSSILTTTSVGGGGGGRTTANNGANGGSGGGGAFDTSGGVGTSGQGNNGGNGNQVGNPSGTATGSGGGGGSGAAGSNGVANGGGAGGTGTDTWSSILNAVNAGVSGRIAGGGGGATDLRSTNNPGPGGSGGGGAGGGTTQGVQGAVNGVTNTGSGGGAGNGGIPQTPGANGGSGIVIIRYPIS